MVSAAELIIHTGQSHWIVRSDGDAAPRVGTTNEAVGVMIGDLPDGDPMRTVLLAD